MVYLLFDNPGDKGKVSFISQMIHGEVNEIYSPKSKRLIVGWLKGCNYALEVSHSYDTIVCWYDFQAILCYWLWFIWRERVLCIAPMLNYGLTYLK